MQQNVATRCRNEFIFENLESKDIFIFTGSTSINKFRDNFFMRLTEVFANLRYKKENRIENVTDEFETYQECYFSLKSFYKEKFPSFVDQEYEKVIVAIKDEKTSADSTANYQVPTYDASTCTVTEIKNLKRMN